MEIKFDEFFGFLRSRSPSPLFYSIDRGFYQYRAATTHLRKLHFSVGRH